MSLQQGWHSDILMGLPRAKTEAWGIKVNCANVIHRRQWTCTCIYIYIQIKPCCWRFVFQRHTLRTMPHIFWQNWLRHHRILIKISGGNQPGTVIVQNRSESLQRPKCINTSISKSLFLCVELKFRSSKTTHKSHIVQRRPFPDYDSNLRDWFLGTKPKLMCFQNMIIVEPVSRIMWAHRRLRSTCANAQVDQSLRWALSWWVA